MVNDLHWKTGSCPFNQAHKLKRTENVMNGDEMREAEMELMVCKT